MTLQGIKLPDEGQEKYKKIRSQRSSVDLSRIKMVKFEFRGPLEEIINMLTYIEDTYNETLTFVKIDEHFAQFSTSIHDLNLIEKFPVIKAAGFVLELDQAGEIFGAAVLFKDSGYMIPTGFTHIVDYYIDPNHFSLTESRRRSIGWPAFRNPVKNFNTWYKNDNPKNPEDQHRIDLNYVFPFEAEWNSEEYIFEKDDGFYRFEPNASFTVENHVLIHCEGIRNTAGIPSDVRVIGKAVFKDNKELNRITLPRLTEIQDEAFSYCSNLKYVKFKKGLKRIGSEAFANCERLTELIIPDSVVEIGDDAFFRCGVEKIVWPKGVKEIPTGMFKECRNLYEITIPPEVTKIGRRAFNRANTIIVYGEPGSTAEEYANNNGLYFRETVF